MSSSRKEARLVYITIFCPKLNCLTNIPIEQVSWHPWEFRGEDYSDSGLDAEVTCTCGKDHRLKDLEI